MRSPDAVILRQWLHEIILIFPETSEPKVAKRLLEHNMLEAADEYMTFVKAGAEANLDKVSRVWVKS